jgi:hypothetical protein
MKGDKEMNLFIDKNLLISYYLHIPLLTHRICLGILTQNDSILYSL